MKWHTGIIITIFLISLAVPIVSAWDEVFPWAGTYYEASTPANVSYIFLNIAGAGGSGKSSQWYASESRNKRGLGGSAGEFGNYTMVPVTYGTNYTIVVGQGGRGSISATPMWSIPAESPSVAGTDSVAFGKTKHGGAGGASGSWIASNGGAGESTNFFSAWVGSSQSGGSVVGYTGGAGGIGAGAGGGGAACNESLTGLDATYGGYGVDGYIHIWDMNGSAANVPYYTASPTNVGYGSIVTFTDESILHDGGNLTYFWDFGDGQTSTTLGTVSHVYISYGVFSTNLTLTSDVSTAYLNKSNYIAVTNVPITAWYTQKTVPFKIVDAYGSDLSGANVSVRYLTNTLPSKDPAYLTSAFGISQTVANDMVNGSIAMYGYTGTNGVVSFAMFPAIQYGITITNESAGLSKYVELYPTDTDYIIRCPLATQAMPTMASTSLANASLYVTEPNASWITWNLLYSDPSGHTTGLTWNVTCWNNMTVMHNNSWGAVGTSTVIVDNYTFPSTPVGMEYVAVYDAVRNTS